MGLRCQQMILGQQCKLPAYKNEMYCRWHKVLREFRGDNQFVAKAAPALAEGVLASGYMYAAGSLTFVFIFCLSLFDRTSNFLWIVAAFFALGWSFVFAADGIMARGDDYPLSLFAFWAKLLAVGMVICITSALILGIDVMATPSHAALLLQQLTNSHQFDGSAIYIVVVAVAFSVIVHGRLLSKRVLFLSPAASVSSEVLTEEEKPVPITRRDPFGSDYKIFQEYRNGFIRYCQNKDNSKQPAFQTRLNGRLRGEVLDLYFDGKGYIFEEEADENTLRRAITLSQELPVYIIAFYASSEIVRMVKKTRKVNIYRLSDMGRTSSRIFEGSEFESYTLTIPQGLRNL